MGRASVSALPGAGGVAWVAAIAWVHCAAGAFAAGVLVAFGRPALGLAEISVLLFAVTRPPVERARANNLVGLAGPVDDQLPRLRVATPSGVEGGIGRPVAMMMSTNRSGHVLIVERPGAWVFGSKYGFAAGQVTDASSVGCVQRWSLIDLAVGAGYQRS